MKLGIVGHASEKFSLDTEALARHVIAGAILAHQPELVISGRSPMGGVDIWAIEIAHELGIATREFPPKARRWDGPGGFKERNLQIATASDHLRRRHGAARSNRVGSPRRSLRRDRRGARGGAAMTRQPSPKPPGLVKPPPPLAPPNRRLPIFPQLDERGTIHIERLTLNRWTWSVRGRWVRAAGIETSLIRATSAAYKAFTRRELR